jgi:putative membrane protein
VNEYPCDAGYCGQIGGGGVTWVGVMDMIALWILAIAAVLLLVLAWQRAQRWRRRGPGRGWSGGGAPSGPAENALGERYARGEISGDEYQIRLAVLRGYPPPGAQNAPRPRPAAPVPPPQAPVPPQAAAPVAPPVAGDVPGPAAPADPAGS